MDQRSSIPGAQLAVTSSRRNCRNILISIYLATARCSSRTGLYTSDQVTPIHRGFHALLILVIAAFARYQSKLLQFSAMARIHSIIVSGVALLTTLLSSSGVQAADDQALPWDGTFQDLTVDTLTDKYLTHILTNRQNGTVGPDQWATITQKGRSPAFNGDTGVATLAVDSEAIFGGQTNFRRSELVQDVAGNTAGTTFFRVSLMKEEAYINLYSWQVVFPESHLFEIRIDASVDPVQLVWYTGGSTETRWSTEFKTETWYNFGIAVSSGELALYFSEGDDALALTKTETYNGDVHGLRVPLRSAHALERRSAVKMAEGKQDVLSLTASRSKTASPAVSAPRLRAPPVPARQREHVNVSQHTSSRGHHSYFLL
ncbi:hypothetical protein GQ600_912 [Phytophthora cactorum]|nr:hypothetical protein GQ600_912 [Phytophthora cactorum]